MTATMQRYNGHPIYCSAVPTVGKNGWWAQGLVFAPTETESPIIEIKGDYPVLDTKAQNCLLVE